MVLFVEQASQAKSALYIFLFYTRCIENRQAKCSTDKDRNRKRIEEEQKKKKKKKKEKQQKEDSW